MTFGSAPKSVGNTAQLVQGAYPFFPVGPFLTRSLRRNAAGTYFRFEVRQGDHASFDTLNDRDRSELSGNLGGFALTNNISYWLSFSSRVTVTPNVISANQNGGWLICGQMHNTADLHDVVSPSPVFTQLYSDANITLITRSSTQDPLLANVSGILRATDTLPWQGVWRNNVYNFSFDPNGAGFLKWWRNGTLMVDTGAIPLGFVDAVGPYWQFGIYSGPPSAQITVAEYANMEPPTTTDLTARIASPLALPIF